MSWHPQAARWRRRGGLVISERFVGLLERVRRKRRKKAPTPPPTFTSQSLPPQDRE
jgi:hypothetical protein